MTFLNKMNVLKKQFFLVLTEADLTDKTHSSPELENIANITEKKLKQAICAVAQDKTSEHNDISFWALRMTLSLLLPTFVWLFQTCLTLSYHSRKFKKTKIIVLHKSNKENYTVLKTYRSIALLNTLSKALKKLIAMRLTALTEKHKLLSNEQMRDWKGQSTLTALELLVEQVCIIWKKDKNSVISLLSLDMAGAFDNTSHS